MNLSDKDVLELNELCSAVIDETLTEAQKRRLSVLLSDSEEARRYYVQALGQSASLHTYAAEMHADAPVARRARSKVYWLAVPLTVAAALAVVVWTALPSFSSRTARAGRSTPINVARLTASKNAQWAEVSFQPGAVFHKGQLVQLTAGVAEITFDSGARILLEGPALLAINSAWDATLRQGFLKASVPAQAIGFRVANPSVEVTDLGTEFSMIADRDGTTDVLVLKGEVEAAPHASLDQNTIVLREKDSRRFAASGVSEVSDQVEKFARFSQPFPLDRFVSDFRYAHWSFDESKGDAFPGQGHNQSVADFTVLFDGGAISHEIHRAGQKGQGLTFSGQFQAKATFPGLSGTAPHTVSCWVRIPEDAPLSDAYAIVAWRSDNSKLSYRPVHISWNRNPTEGALGALRTDFSGGCALGTTSLRDGRWHHLAVVFAPGADAMTPVQVKQYVDGRLESSTIIPGRVRGPSGRPDAALRDIVWLGCRLGTAGPRQERFRGDIDELYIADYALEPSEIVQLMTENRLSVTPKQRLVDRR